MPYASQNDFIKFLESAGELIRVKEYVSPNLEITEIADRFSKNDGKALLFENTGTPFPLLINAMGSEKRICMALGVNNLEEISTRIMDLANEIMSPKDSFFSKLSLLPTLAGVSSWMPRRISGRGKCQEIVMDEPDLSKLPALTCWPYDGGPFITLPVVHTRHPETGQRNVGMYRMQVFDKTTTGMHWHLHKNSAFHYREYKRLGMKMPVAVTLGGDPVYTYCATAPLPENLDEYLLAGFIRKKRVEMVRCLTCDLEVPNDADIVIEGYVDPAEDLALEGPFGDHTGFYSLADYYPAFHVTCITHRKKAIYPATIVGIPPQEDAWIGKATERIFLAPIRLSLLPEIIDMDMPVEGVFHNIVLVKISKSYPGQALKVMNSLWGAGQMMFNKVLIVTDGNVDLNNSLEVLKTIALNTDPAQDILITRGPVDVLDHSSSRFALGSKLGIDATTKWPEEKGKIPSKSDTTNNLIALLKSQGIQTVLSGLLDHGIPLIILGIQKQKPGQVRDLHHQLASEGVLEGIGWVVYIDQHAAGLGWGDIVWLVANNIDPLRDCFYAPGHASMAIDGTIKTRLLDGFDREWPNIITMSEEVIREIDNRWALLGLGEFIQSPSLKYQSLIQGKGAVAKQ